MVASAARTRIAPKVLRASHKSPNKQRRQPLVLSISGSSPRIAVVVAIRQSTDSSLASIATRGAARPRMLSLRFRNELVTRRSSAKFGLRKNSTEFRAVGGWSPSTKVRAIDCGDPVHSADATFRLARKPPYSAASMFLARGFDAPTTSCN